MCDHLRVCYAPMWKDMAWKASATSGRRMPGDSGTGRRSTGHGMDGFPSLEPIRLGDTLCKPLVAGKDNPERRGKYLIGYH